MTAIDSVLPKRQVVMRASALSCLERHFFCAVLYESHSTSAKRGFLTEISAAAIRPNLNS
jgi:hypothetical protein